MNPTELDKQILYFEMLVREGESPVLDMKGIARMDASPSCVSINWLDYPNATRAHSVVFSDEEVSQFIPNKSGRTFDIAGQSHTPAFVYIQKRTSIGEGNNSVEAPIRIGHASFPKN